MTPPTEGAPSATSATKIDFETLVDFAETGEGTRGAAFAVEWFAETLKQVDPSSAMLLLKDARNRLRQRRAE